MRKESDRRDRGREGDREREWRYRGLEGVRIGDIESREEERQRKEREGETMKGEKRVRAETRERV